MCLNPNYIGHSKQFMPRDCISTYASLDVITSHNPPEVEATPTHKQIADTQFEKTSRDALFLIAQKFEPKIRKALVDAFNQIRNQHTIDTVAEALQQGGITRVQSLFANTPDIIDQHLVSVLTQAVMESGRAMINYMPKGSFTEAFNFDILDANTSLQLRAHNSRLVREISNNTMKAITQQMNANVIAGRNPRSAARDLRGIVGLTHLQERAVRNLDNELRRLDAGALERELVDGRQRRTIQNAIDRNSPLKESQIQKITKRYRERFLDYRTRVIARTESLRATSMGEFLSLDQANRQGKINRDVKRFWVATNDLRTRNQHRRMPADNAKGVGINEPFIAFTRNGTQTVLMYPRDPQGLPELTIQCRCRVIYKLGKKTSPTPVITKPKAKPKPKQLEQRPGVPSTVKDADVYLVNNVGTGSTIKGAAKENVVPVMDSVVHHLEGLQPTYRERMLQQFKVESLGTKAKETMGTQNTSKKRILLNLDQLKKKGVNKTVKGLADTKYLTPVADDVGYMVDHEFGHLIQEGLPDDLFDEWRRIGMSRRQKGISTSDSLKRKKGDVSFYGESNFNEMFAESWAWYINPKYGKTPGGFRLPKEMESFFDNMIESEKVFKKGYEPRRWKR